MKIIYSLILFIMPFLSKAQISDFYNQKGQLIVDTTYMVTDVQNLPVYTDFSGFNYPLIYKFVQNFNYPIDWMNGGIEGTVIIELKITKTTNRNNRTNLGRVDELNLVHIINESGKQDLLDYSHFLLSGFFQFPEDYVLEDTYTLYIPILFKFNFLEQENSKENCSLKKFYKNNLLTVEFTNGAIIYKCN